jgi:hypothetical protein
MCTEVVMAVSRQQQTQATIWEAGMDMARRYVSAYRETLLTDSQIVAAMTADARSSGFSVEDSSEIAECGFEYLERNHQALNA